MTIFKKMETEPKRDHMAFVLVSLKTDVHPLVATLQQNKPACSFI